MLVCRPFVVVGCLLVVLSCIDAQCTTYQATPLYQSTPGMDTYCQLMCGSTVFCPEAQCQCSTGEEETTTTWTALESCPYPGITNDWCDANCRGPVTNCPEACCASSTATATATTTSTATATPDPTPYWAMVESCPYAGVTDAWCQNNCAHEGSAFCPETCCQSVDPTSTSPTPSPTSLPTPYWIQLSTCPYPGVTSEWCQNNCDHVGSQFCIETCCFLVDPNSPSASPSVAPSSGDEITSSFILQVSEAVETTDIEDEVRSGVQNTLPEGSIITAFSITEANEKAATTFIVQFTATTTTSDSSDIDSALDTTTLETNIQTALTFSGSSTSVTDVNNVDTDPSPSPTPSGPVFVASAGEYQTFMIMSNGQVWGWGRNNRDQVGIDTSGSNVQYPVRIPSLEGLPASDINQIVGGDDHTAVLMSDGTVYTFGYNNRGQLGVLANNPSQTPNLTLVESPPSNIEQLEAGGDTTYAITTGGDVWGWGSGESGALQNAGTDHVPVQLNLTNVAQLSMFKYFGLALDTSGTVWAWGANYYGQAGPGPDPQVTPHQMTGLPLIQMVTAGEISSHALDENGNVFSWGSNSNGQFGNGTYGESTAIPTQATNVNQTFVSIHAGSYFVLAVTGDGKVFGTGYNYANEVLNSTMNDVYVFTETEINSLINGVDNIACGAYHCVFVDNDNQVYTTGWDGYGSLGNGAGESNEWSLVQFIEG